MNTMMRARTAELNGDTKKAAELYKLAIKTAPDEESKKAALVNMSEVAARTAAPIPIAKPVPVSEMKEVKAPMKSQAMKEITGRDGAPMVLIPQGVFTMGSDTGEADERPPHRISLRELYMDKYEVTNALFAAFLNAWGRDTDEDGQVMFREYKWNVRRSQGGWEPQPGYENCPVVEVSWYGAVQYAKYYGLRLPTEAEWEYACRAGSTGAWCFGNTESVLVNYAWYSVNSGNQPHPAGKKTANAWGLYDMHGNVWEWCSDQYDSGYYSVSPASNPPGPAFGTYRVLRGGSWSGVAINIRSSDRGGYYPGLINGVYGFRCVLSP